jgi:hypothetical protein
VSDVEEGGAGGGSAEEAEESAAGGHGSLQRGGSGVDGQAG